METYDDVFSSSESYDVAMRSIKSNNLEKLKKLYQNELLTRETIEKIISK
jgi:hypothetical protein